MPDDKNKSLLLTVLKLAAGAIALIGFFGLGIYFAAKYNTYAPPDKHESVDWGISKDSPIPSRR